MFPANQCLSCKKPPSPLFSSTLSCWEASHFRASLAPGSTTAQEVRYGRQRLYCRAAKTGVDLSLLSLAVLTLLASPHPSSRTGQADAYQALGLSQGSHAELAPSGPGELKVSGLGGR